MGQQAPCSTSPLTATSETSGNGARLHDLLLKHWKRTLSFHQPASACAFGMSMSSIALPRRTLLLICRSLTKNGKLKLKERKKLPSKIGNNSREHVPLSASLTCFPPSNLTRTWGMRTLHVREQIPYGTSLPPDSRWFLGVLAQIQLAQQIQLFQLFQVFHPHSLHEDPR